MKRVVFAVAVLVAGTVAVTPTAEAGWIYVDGRWIPVAAPPGGRWGQQYSCYAPDGLSVPNEHFIVHNPPDNRIEVTVNLKENGGKWEDLKIKPGYYHTLPCSEYDSIVIGTDRKGGEPVKREYGTKCGRHYYVSYHYVSQTWDIFHVAE